MTVRRCFLWCQRHCIAELCSGNATLYIMISLVSMTLHRCSQQCLWHLVDDLCDVNDNTSMTSGVSMPPYRRCPLHGVNDLSSVYDILINLTLSQIIYTLFSTLMMMARHSCCSWQSPSPPYSCCSCWCRQSPSPPYSCCSCWCRQSPSPSQFL
jgi:hypothetical protein